MGSQDSNLYALNANGTLKWKKKFSGAIGGSPAVDAAGNLYSAEWDGSPAPFSAIH